MRRVLLVVIFCIIADCDAMSQELNGLWRGSFKSQLEAISIPPISISLGVVWQGDSSYFIQSITSRDFYYKGNYFKDSIFWHVKLNYNNRDSVEMEEIALIKITEHERRLKSKGKKIKNPFSETGGGCPQIFRLKILKSEGPFKLVGTWLSTGAECYDHGWIEFVKVADKLEEP